MAERETAAALFRLILAPERRFYGLIFVYGIAVSTLSLALPLSVQVLIGTVTNTGLVRPVVVLALVLFALLLLSGLFAATQVYVMELFERRFFTRIVSEVTLRLIYALPAHMNAINRDELVNRFFDIMTVQKSLPPLLVGGLGTVLQIAVGVAVTSFYHPMFLFFNVATLIFGYVVFRVCHRGAATSSIALSSTKYATANWLETLARSNDLFKSRRAIEYALSRTEQANADYVADHRRHFHFTFAQILGFLFVYALTSSALLGVAGWLVIEGELTIGQLVAAELILTAIFYGLGRTGYYLELYYDLYAAMSKLSQLYRIPHERAVGQDVPDAWEPAITFSDIKASLHGHDIAMTFSLPPGGSTLIATRSSAQVSAFTDLLLGKQPVDRGRIRLGDYDISDINPQSLRDAVHVIDGADFPDCSIAEFLAIAKPNISRSEIRQLLRDVGLALDSPTIALDLDRVITPDGSPLSTAGVVKLKIAYAIASRPPVLVLTPLFDMLSRESRESVLRSVAAALPRTSLLCFSHRQDSELFDRYMLWDYAHQTEHPDLERLMAAYSDVLRAPAGDVPA
jgi:putative ABC transport system ATP-binding protein